MGLNYIVMSQNSSEGNASTYTVGCLNALSLGRGGFWRAKPWQSQLLRKCLVSVEVTSLPKTVGFQKASVS